MANFPASLCTGDMAGTVATSPQLRLSAGKWVAQYCWDARAIRLMRLDTVMLINGKGRQMGLHTERNRGAWHSVVMGY